MNRRGFCFLGVGLCRFALRVAGQAPIIDSFTPTSGPIGTPVTINGANFSATASSNIVYFGAVRALVTSAATNSLVVLAPAGANYRPMTVTTAGLTAASKAPFIVTFAGTQALQFDGRS